MRKYAIVLFTILLTGFIGVSPKAAVQPLEFFVDGVKIEGTEQPLLGIGGQVLLPVQPLFEAAGFHVATGNSGDVQVSNSFLTLDIKSNSGAIYVNGEAVDTEFPLTRRGAVHYVSNEFLSTLEGFNVSFTKDRSTIDVKTNRSRDIGTFLDKLDAVKFTGYSSKSTLDHRTVFSYDPDTVEFTLDANLTVNEKPNALSMDTVMETKVDGKPVKQTSELYFTNKGVWEYKEDIGKWVRLGDEPSLTLMETYLPAPHPIDYLTRIEDNSFLQLYDYGDVLVLVERIKDENLEDDLVSSRTDRYMATQFDKRTSLPFHALTITGTTIETDEDSVFIKERLTQTFRHDETVNQVQVPAKVVRDAISEEAYWKEIGVFDEF